ncbi:MAG TPA: DUF2235 domain-containing protein [Candidatus Thermoplasmatota archaeon]|nr:DUF2235 domain-containing protein [Candidatus Thermoplasmatota archaeon]
MAPRPETAPAPPRKRLIVCLDGTWSRADDRRHATNVVAAMRAIAPAGRDGTQQVIFYGKGVGTGGLVDRLVGGLTGAGLEDNVKDAYLFLANNYSEGDEIYVFGFSRGAYTARSLVGFLSAVGLQDRLTLRNLAAAWDIYRTPKEERPADPLAEAGGRRVHVEALAVWDTVGSLGIPVRWFNPFDFLKLRHQFHDVALSAWVRNAFHAIAVDEKRGAFPPTLWQRKAGEPDRGQRVEQVWFAGVHSDVGGGYYGSDSEEAAYGIHQLPLQWMMERVAATTGLELHPRFGQMVAAADPLAPMHESRTALFFLSRLLPFDRVIGGKDGWARTFLRSRNEPEPGWEFAGEALHESVLLRLGNPVVTLDGGRELHAPYAPANVEAAKDAVPLAPWSGA